METRRKGRRREERKRKVKREGEEEATKRGEEGWRQCRTGRNKRIRASSVDFRHAVSTVACMRAHSCTLFAYACMQRVHVCVGTTGAADSLCPRKHCNSPLVSSLSLSLSLSFSTPSSLPALAWFQSVRPFPRCSLSRNGALFPRRRIVSLASRVASNRM